MGKTVKLYTINGFLGSGKTTFLKDVLQKNESVKLGVIQNEFGKMSIDGELLQKDGLEMVEINRGSIYCSCLQLSFIEALKEMAEREMDYVFVEGSGLADPSNMDEILDALHSVHPDAMDYRGSICLVDAAQFLTQLEEIETVEKQLKHSQMAVINKVDLVDISELAKIKDVVKSIKEDIIIHETSFGKLDFDFMEKDLLKLSPMHFDETHNSVDNKPKTLHMTFDGSVSKSGFDAFIQRVKGDCYRIKGFAEIDGEGCVQVDAVGPKIDYKKSDKNEEGGNIVFISKIGPKVIKPLFAAWQEEIGTEMKVR